MYIVTVDDIFYAFIRVTVQKEVKKTSAHIFFQSKVPWWSTEVGGTLALCGKWSRVATLENV